MPSNDVTSKSDGIRSLAWPLSTARYLVLDTSQTMRPMPGTLPRRQKRTRWRNRRRRARARPRTRGRSSPLSALRFRLWPGCRSCPCHRGFLLVPMPLGGFKSNRSGKLDAKPEKADRSVDPRSWVNIPHLARWARIVGKAWPRWYAASAGVGHSTDEVDRAQHRFWCNMRLCTRTATRVRPGPVSLFG